MKNKCTQLLGTSKPRISCWGDGVEVQLCLESLQIWHSSPQKRSKFSVIHTVYMSAGLGFSQRKHIHLVTCRICRGALKEPHCCNKTTVQGKKINMSNTDYASRGSHFQKWKHQLQLKRNEVMEDCQSSLPPAEEICYDFSRICCALF